MIIMKRTRSLRTNPTYPLYTQIRLRRNKITASPTKRIIPKSPRASQITTRNNLKILAVHKPHVVEISIRVMDRETQKHMQLMTVVKFPKRKRHPRSRQMINTLASRGVASRLRTLKIIRLTSTGTIKPMMKQFYASRAIIVIIRMVACMISKRNTRK